MNSVFLHEVARTEIVWVITQPVVVIPYRRFGKHWFHLQGSRTHKKPPVKNYHYWLRKKAEERSSHMNRQFVTNKHQSFVQMYLCVAFSETAPTLSHISSFYSLLSYLRSILILSFHICIGLQVFFREVPKPNSVYISRSHTVPHSATECHTVPLTATWLSCSSHNKQRLFPCTTLTDWFV